MRFLHVGVDDFFELLQGFSHDVNVLNVQEHELGILVLVSLVAPSCGLEKRRGGGKTKSAFIYPTLAKLARLQQLVQCEERN